MATFSIRMDNDTKRDFDKFCESVGLTVSAAFNIFAKKVVRENRIPFEITGDNPFSLHQAIYDTDNRENLYGPFASAEEAVNSMLED